MSTCLRRKSEFSDGVFYRGSCRNAISSPTISMSSSQLQVTSQDSPASLSASRGGDLNVRLEKAMRRAELLGYAAAGLGVAILFAIIGVAFV